jgi:hypothetical protein
MPRIPRFRDARGRWLARDANPDDIASVEIYDTRGPRIETVSVEDYFRPIVDFGPPAPLWTVDEQERTIIWRDFDQERTPDFSTVRPPEGVSQFRVFFDNGEGGESPSGVISTTWMDIELLPKVTLDMVRGGNPTGYRSVVFER